MRTNPPMISIILSIGLMLFVWVLSELNLKEKTIRVILTVLLVVGVVFATVFCLQHPKFHIWLWMFLFAAYLGTIEVLLDLRDKEKPDKIIKVLNKAAKVISVVAGVIYFLYAFGIIDESFPLIGEFLFIHGF